MRPTRREFLVGLFAAVVVGNVTKLLTPATTEETAEALLSTLPNRASARAIGRVFLEERSEEGSRDRLIRKILGDDRGGGALADPGALRVYLRDRIRLDFARSETIELDGWVLSLTEVRLCALATTQA
jgi:hypothetical protein